MPGIAEYVELDDTRPAESARSRPPEGRPHETSQPDLVQHPEGENDRDIEDTVAMMAIPTMPSFRPGP